MINRYIISLLALAALLFAACGDDDDDGSAGSGGSGGSAGSEQDGGDGAGSGGDGGSGGEGMDAGEDAGEADAGFPTESNITGLVVDAETSTGFDHSAYDPLEGVKVCVLEHDEVACDTTGADGAYELTGIPRTQGEVFHLTYEKEGYSPTLYAPPIGALEDFEATAIIMGSDSYGDQLLSDAGMTREEGNGLILFGAITAGGPEDSEFYMVFGGADFIYVEGYTVSIEPAAVAGPVYTGTDWKPDPDLTESSAAGWGMIAAEAGDYELTFTHPELNCISPTLVKVMAGYTTTYAGTACLVPADAGI